MEPVLREVMLYGLEHYQCAVEQIIEDLGIRNCEFEVRMILVEAVMNAYHHGNLCDSTKPIIVRYVLDGYCLSIQVEDCGSGGFCLDIPDEIADDRLLDEGGRGLYLIHCFSDKVERIENVTHISKTLTCS